MLAALFAIPSAALILANPARHFQSLELKLWHIGSHVTSLPAAMVCAGPWTAGAAMDWPKLRARLLKLFIDQFLLISYFVAALIALTWPTPGKAVLSLDVSCVLQGRTCCIFLCCWLLQTQLIFSDRHCAHQHSCMRRSIVGNVWNPPAQACRAPAPSPAPPAEQQAAPPLLRTLPPSVPQFSVNGRSYQIIKTLNIMIGEARRYAC